MLNEFINNFTTLLVYTSTNSLIPLMLVIYFAAVFFRGLVFYTVKREEWFAREFEKRVDLYVSNKPLAEQPSFYPVTKKLLEKTYYELFELRALWKRRKPDFIMAMSDRVFLIQQGCAWFVRDILKQVKFLPFTKESNPKLFDITKKTLSRNPCFNKVFGIIPTSTTTDILNLLPGVFIVLGILGTFLGIMDALPKLGDMNLSDIEQTKKVMDDFLGAISFSMSTSLFGIILSVTMSFINAFLSPYKPFIQAVERLESSMDTLWHVSVDNNVPTDIDEFDEHADPVEALASQSVDKQLEKKKGSPIDRAA